MLIHEVSITNPNVIRGISSDENFISKELYKQESDGHQFKIDDICSLTGLVGFPEYNKTTVKITAIRKDGTYGKCYYVRGDINKFMNWVYECRLEKLEAI